MICKKARWKEANGHLPVGAVRGGRQNTIETYVCRANHEGGTIPGSYIVQDNFERRCHISHNFSVFKKAQFEVSLSTLLNTVIST